MNIDEITNNKITLLGRLAEIVLLVLILWAALCVPAWSDDEVPLKLPKTEGSRNFDLEIDRINNQGIRFYQQGEHEKAGEQFKKALNLAQQLRDPSQGILHYNLALGLHKSGQHEPAAKQFHAARRYARGNKRILQSELLRQHECGLNPGGACKDKVPLPMTIEGSR